MQDDVVFRSIVLILFVGARYVRWHARHDINWKVSWPAMKMHPRDTIVLIILSLLWLAAAVIYMAVPRLVASFALPFPTWLRCCAAVVALGGLALIRWSDRSLGKNLSVTLRIRDNHTLVTGGPYSRIRHPIYTAALIYSTAMATITSNYVLGAMFVVPMAGLIAQRIKREEQMMIDQFGQEYRAYMLRTPRLLPRIW